MAAAAKKLLLVGSSADALEAKRVVLERAGYVVSILTKGGSVRKVAEDIEASLVIIDTSAGLRPVRRKRQSSRGPDVRAALIELSGELSGELSSEMSDEMSGETRGGTGGGEAPSTIPVLVIGPADALGEFDGPGEVLSKPAEKRALLDSTRKLVEGFHDGARRKWSRRSRA